MKLVVRDQEGQLSLTCPTCRQATPIPANGVTGLQSAFRVNHLLEILEEAKDTAASQEGAKSVVTRPIPPRKVIANCFEHTDTERQLYCETCEDLICFKCAIKGGKHHDHDHHLLDEAFERYKGEVGPSLEPMEGKLVAIKEVLTQLDKHCGEISDQRVAIEINIHNAIGRLRQILDIRETELIGQLHKVTQTKLKRLAVQRNQMETIQAQLSSCLDFVRESLETDSQGEVLMMKTNIVKQVKELTSPFQAGVLKPNTEADVEFWQDKDTISKVQNYGQVFIPGVPDPSKCQITDKGLQGANVGEKSTAVVKVVDFKGEPCMESINSLECELVSVITGAPERGVFEHKGGNLYNIGYQPAVKGKHQLCIKIEDTHIRGSPFEVAVKMPVEKLGTPIHTIGGVQYPTGVVVNQKGEVIVIEGKGVSLFSPSGKKCRLFGTHGSGQGQFLNPWGLTVDGDGCIYVTDIGKHCIQKFTNNGQFLCAVGTKGKGHLQFNEPSYVAFNSVNGKLYVTDTYNRRVRVLNSDLTFSSTFGSYGSGKGQFSYPYGIACDATGNVYVADCGNNNIQVFTAEWRFLRVFSSFGFGRGGLDRPYGVAVDSNGLVYVSELLNHRVSVFTSEGRFVKSFGEHGNGLGQFVCPRGLAVDSNGVLYVCDTNNNRVQIF